MFQLLSTVLWPLAQPSNLLLLLLALAAIGTWRGRRRALRLLGAVTLTFAAVGLMPVGQWLLLPLENRFAQPADLPARVDGVVMLGGSVALGVSEARATVALRNEAERPTTLVELARAHPAARLLVTGGGEPVTEAAVLLRFFRDQKLPLERVLFENRARDTWENAVLSQALAKPAAGERWLLVTSAAHMPRAVGCFETIGWPVIPYPVDYRTTGRLEPWLGGTSFFQRAQPLDLP
jgi:uncharacterized SAM-binding protein YcdF (DUF218 family)